MSTPIFGIRMTPIGSPSAGTGHVGRSGLRRSGVVVVVPGPAVEDVDRGADDDVVLLDGAVASSWDRSSSWDRASCRFVPHSW